MATTNDHGKMPPATNTLSIDQLITGLRSEAFARIRFHADRLAQLGNAIETLDAALMTLQSDHSASEQQDLVDAARQLSNILNRHPAKPFDHAAASRRELAAAKRRFAGRELPIVPTTGGVPW